MVQRASPQRPSERADRSPWRRYEPSLLFLRWTLLLAAFRPVVCAQGDDSIQAIFGSFLQSNYTEQAITVADALGLCQSGAPRHPVVESTITDIHTAFLKKQLNCTQLVQDHVQRIQAYDQRSGVNSVRVISPSLQKDAAVLDAVLQQVHAGNQPLPKLFCVPLLIKDNYDTVGMSASNGAVGLLDNYPTQDAYQIAKVKQAGAIVLGKTNMAEWAFSPDISTGSAFGVVRNPYAMDYSTGGSSGGTAAGVAASFGMVGLGSDTGNSIRGPAAWTSLVGLRASLGLTSRSGMIPLDSTSDVGGPLGRTVEDVVRVFEVTVGVDLADNLTTMQKNYAIPGNYTQFLKADVLKGMRIGVMRQVIDMTQADDEVMLLFEQALLDLQSAGATVVDNFTIVGNALGSRDWDGSTTWFTGFGQNSKEEQLECGARFKYDVNGYLASAGSKFKSVQDLVGEGLYHPSSNSSMIVRLSIPYIPAQYPPPELQAQGYLCNCDQLYNNPCRVEFRQRLQESMDNLDLAVIVFPTWSNPPPLIGDYGAPDGNNSPQISPSTGAPAIAVPMGFSKHGTLSPPLPASLQFLARPFDEGTLISAAYSYEQKTSHRRQPAAFPECTDRLAPARAPAMLLSARASPYQPPPYNSLG